MASHPGNAEAKPLRILFLQPVVSHVRYQRRLENLEKLGAKVEILSFVREYYAGRDIGRSYVSLGRIEHGNYLKRIPLLFHALLTARKNTRSYDVIYSFGLDMAVLAHIARIGVRPRPKLVYEVGDIVEVFLRSGFIARAWRMLEGFLLGRADLLVTTSDAFLRDYFEPVHGSRLPESLVVENKPMLALTEGTADRQSAYPADGEPLRIGWFGLLRCSRSVEILSEVVRQAEGRIQVDLRGIEMVGLNLEEWAASNDNVHFTGPYVAPDELPEMYSTTHLIWGCFPLFDADRNEMLSGPMARTNRFYEACFFRRPLITRVDSPDGRMVEKNRIGLCIDLRNQAETINRVLSIGREEVEAWSTALDRLPKGVYSYTDEHERLLRQLQVGESKSDKRAI